MKALFLCSWCGKTIACGDESRHFKTYHGLPTWEIKEVSRRPRHVAIKNFEEPHILRMECDGYKWR